MNASDDNSYLLEEYKTLRNEIEHNQSDNFRIISLGLTLISGLFGLAYSEFIKEVSWLILFTPCLILMPMTLLIGQRTRATWRLGRYIQFFIEPKLGFEWEKVNYLRKVKENTDKGFKDFWDAVTSFVGSSGYSLVMIQVICPFLSWIQIRNSQQSNNPIIIEFVALTLLVLLFVVAQIRVLYEANHPAKFTQDMVDLMINVMKKEKNKTDSISD